MSSTKSKVYFGSVQQGRLLPFASFAAKVDKITDILIEQTKINKRDKVAIKMHLGFNVGYQTIPELKMVIRLLLRSISKDLIHLILEVFLRMRMY